MVNEVALVMLWGLLGWKIALLYIATGVTVAIISGILIGKRNATHALNQQTSRAYSVEGCQTILREGNWKVAEGPSPAVLRRR